MSKFSIEGLADLREPTSVSFKKYNITTQDRTMSGNLVVDYIVTKNAVSVSWSVLTDAEFKSLTQLLEPKRTANGFISLSCVLPNTDEMTPIAAYTEEINYYPYFMADGSVVWRDVSVEFVEV